MDLLLDAMGNQSYGRGDPYCGGTTFPDLWSACCVSMCWRLDVLLVLRCLCLSPSGVGCEASRVHSSCVQMHSSCVEPIKHSSCLQAVNASLVSRQRRLCFFACNRQQLLTFERLWRVGSRERWAVEVTLWAVEMMSPPPRACRFRVHQEHRSLVGHLWSPCPCPCPCSATNGAGTVEVGYATGCRPCLHSVSWAHILSSLGGVYSWTCTLTELVKMVG